MINQRWRRYYECKYKSLEEKQQKQNFQTRRILQVFRQINQSDWWERNFYLADFWWEIKKRVSLHFRNILWSRCRWQSAGSIFLQILFKEWVVRCVTAKCGSCHQTQPRNNARLLTILDTVQLKSITWLVTQKTRDNPKYSAKCS